MLYTNTCLHLLRNLSESPRSRPASILRAAPSVAPQHSVDETTLLASY
ncbi:hypothetical protein RchiOBHm_Chr6g0271701 [Rosa chinensis]|uniref:Uncharacterized protein n=1 Tax=Rosa chinensis TaxID=74649 RepID=A0A2P6PR18_ROSCH|nr:hypothetical protein RchiOBHm_Chr6g0271701 [Rosa chinensis]